MSKKKRFGVSQALSRGLSETIHVVENNSGIFRNVIVPLTRIELDPNNPRKLAITLSDVQQGLKKSDGKFAQKSQELEKLNELSTTIKSSGIINPIVVYKRGELYRIIAGERRCLASILAGRLEIEARVFNDKPKGFELKLIQWIENTAREDLNLEERINNIQEIIQEYKNQNGEVSINATFLKGITGLSLPQSSYYITVLNAPDDVKQMIEKGKIRSLDKAAIIASILSPEIRKEALQACLAGCSLKELRQVIAREKQIFKKSSWPISPSKRGRTAVRINMGYTLNAKVVQCLVESVLNQAPYKKYSTTFNEVNWDHLEQSSRAFKKLIQILEHEVAK